MANRATEVLFTYLVGFREYTVCTEFQHEVVAPCLLISACKYGTDKLNVVSKCQPRCLKSCSQPLQGRGLLVLKNELD